MTQPLSESYPGTVYLAPDGYVDDLVAELGLTGGGTVGEVDGRLVFAPGPARAVVWAQNIWFDPVLIPFTSIKDAARALRGIQRNWALWSTRHHRRANLIQENLPHVSAKPLVFPAAAPTAPLGSWTLLDENTLLAAARCSSPFRHGEVTFVEDKATPPNRAYLKLWEALTRLGRRPGEGDRCMDLGACPGGWTWVLHECGASVIAVDKAPLDPAIAALPRVEYRQDSAFAIRPDQVGPLDWLTCDVICYPDRLLRLVETWHGSGLVKNFVCTIKFQGATDFDAVHRLASIPGGQIVHLSHNKHELTWLWPAP